MECADKLEKPSNSIQNRDVNGELTDKKNDFNGENQQFAANFASYLTYLYQHSLASNILHNSENLKSDFFNTVNLQQYLSKLLLLKNLSNPLLCHNLIMPEMCSNIKSENESNEKEVLDMKYFSSPPSVDTSSSCFSDSCPNYSTCSSPGPEDLRVTKSTSFSKSETLLKNENSSITHFNKCLTNTKNNSFKLDQNVCSTQDIAKMIAAELRHYCIPQAVFSQKVLGRSQGTLSDLLRNPKPWNKLKAGKETFKRMLDWLNQSEEQRLAMLKYNSSSSNTKSKNNSKLNPLGNPKELSSLSSTSPLSITPATTLSPVHTPLMQPEEHHHHQQQLDLTTNNNKPSRKPRLVFTEIQRRTLMAIFKEVKRPSRDVQLTIAEQLNLKLSTVSNFFMNARRRSLDKFISPDSTNYEDSENINQNVINNINKNIDQSFCDDGGACTEDDNSCNMPVDFSIKEEMD